MKPNLLLIVAAIYLALIGLGFLLAPSLMVFSALPSGVPEGVFAELRQYGGALLGIAVLNWIARNAEASKAKDGVFYGNTVGFGLVALGGVLRQLSGAMAVGWVFVVIHLLFAIAFFIVGRTNRSKNVS
ncbi:MAG: hypothetical protein WCF84_20360 [Anaerolineae bacterium]